MLFFGFCLGDAGYGVFFILFATIMKSRVKKELKPILSLTQYLGVATILFGLLSGTFFGVNLIDSGYTLTSSSIGQIEAEQMPEGVVADLRSIEGEYFKSREDFSVAVGSAIGEEAMETHEVVILKSAEAGIPLVGKFRHLMQDSLSMFYLSLLIGGIQIIFGIFVRILNITRQRGFKYALSTLGWFILILTLILNATLLGENGGRYVFYGLLGVSGILIFFLNSPGKNIFLQFGAGIWDSYGMVTGIFGDLLSYIRLFALGISSAILGFVFNDISLQLLNIPYLGWRLFLILLLAGHSINLFLATLGGFIHPMRLTFVEFYKNAGFQGGGKKYHPFTIHN
jgi:vacuolar-type H+-ATPase subunit I/STV1